MKARKIPLKHFSENEGDDYKSLLLNILRSPKDPQKGTSLVEIEKTIPLIEKLKLVTVPKHKDAEVLFDESEWDGLVDKVRVFPFGANDEKIYRFCKDILDAEQVDVEEKKSTGKKAKRGK